MDYKVEALAWVDSARKAHTDRDWCSEQEPYWDKDYKDPSSVQAPKVAHHKQFPDCN